MEHQEQNDMKTNIASTIMWETKRLNDLADSGQEPSADSVEPMALEDFQAAFKEYEDDFLSDELLEQVLNEVGKNRDSIKKNYPEGTKLLVAALPCNINGMLFSDEDMKKGRYLTAFFISKKTGLSTGFGALRPSTHAKLLPKEIREKCSFTVHYDSVSPYSEERDFEQFAEQYRKAYYELRRLLKPN